MNFGIYSYAITTAIFCGLALVLYGIGRLLGKRSAMFTQTDWKAVMWTIVILLFITGPGEHVALAWRAWEYNPERTLHTIFFGAEIETYLFTLLVSIATIVYVRREERKREEHLHP